MIFDTSKIITFSLPPSEHRPRKIIRLKITKKKRLALKKTSRRSRIIRTHIDPRSLSPKKIYGIVDWIKQGGHLSDKRILTSLIYWGSGSKYPGNNFIAYSNSDVGLVKLFLNLLRSSYSIIENKIKIHLQLHKDQNVDKMIEYWSKELNIPTRQFYKPTVTSPLRFRHRQYYFGTCTIRYYDLKLLLKILNTYKKFISDNFETK